MEASAPISWVDVAVGGVLLISALLAFTRGMMHEVLSIIPWIGAGVATIYGYPLVKPHAREFIGIDLAADITAGVVLFFASFVVLSMLTRALTAQLPESALNAFDRSLGFLFGLARGALLVCLAYIGLEMTMPPSEHPAWVRDARTLPAVEHGVAWLRKIVPAEVVSKGSKVQNEVERAREAGRMMERLLSPAPAGPTSDPDKGYGRAAREQLDRLIETTR